MIELIEYEDNVITAENVGEKLHRRRCEMGMSLADLSRKSLLAIATIDKVENGRFPMLYTIVQMADPLGYEVILREKR